MLIKKWLRSFGFDIRRHHSLYSTTLKHHNIKTILDIGANDGHWSAEMRTLYPTAQIYAFEPLKDCFAGLVKKFESDTRFKAFNIALGDTDGKAKLSVAHLIPVLLCSTWLNFTKTYIQKVRT